jgi:D-glycero-alpha-D-manno-heptose 1-phosphate guanylyltransferase
MSEVLILAGGLGTRLRSVISDVPKALAPIAGQPFLKYLLQYALRQKVNRVVISTGVGAEHIQSFLDSVKYPFSIETTQEPKPLGTGGAIQFSLPKMKRENFFVINGDTILDVNLKEMEKQHLHKNARITIGTTQIQDTKRYGRVKIRPNSIIEGFEEKGASGPGSINGGVIMIHRDVFDQFSKPAPFSFESDEILINLFELLFMPINSG